MEITMVNTRSSKYEKTELMDRAYYRIAWNIFHMWEESGSSDSRLLQEPLIPEVFVVVGKSRKGTSRKEHVVPRVVICDICHRLYDQGATIEDVAQVIKKLLKIVLIDKEEQKYLDHKLNLKQVMPDDWDFKEGDIFKRLKEANIEFDFL